MAEDSSDPYQTPGAAPESRPQVQDEVTGGMVPADETIDLHGYRVGPEGKQLLMERLQSGKPIAGGPERPGFWRRVGCFLLDYLILLAITLVVVCIVSFPLGAIIAGMGPPSQPGPGSGPAAMPRWQFVVNGVVGVALGTIYIAYFAIQHGNNGQTVGKRAGHIRVVNLDLTPISNAVAWKRGLYFLGPNFVGSALMPLIALMPSFFVLIPVYLVGTAGGVYVLVDVIVGLADTHQQRALHDRFTGTRVIWEPV